TYVPKDNAWTSIRTTIADAKTLRSISYASDGKETKVNLNFAETITGNYYSKKTKKEKKINLQPTRPFVDFNWTDHLISTLPLDLGYKARIPQFYYNSDSDIFVEDYTIKEVKSYSYGSPKTGKHDSWLVTLLEESTGAIYNYV
ncbi:hypothetical protein HF633_13260, partial [Weissella cibaria]|nr:hypothetical protein [Weissella cibaria]